MEKDFTEWERLKQHLHHHVQAPHFSQGEIWWCSIGVNIGHEQDGKHERATRPVIIIRKFNPHLFLGIPLTTKIKHNPYSHQFRFQGQEQCALLSQLRLWDSKRLDRRMGALSKGQLRKLVQKIQEMIEM